MAEELPGHRIFTLDQLRTGWAVDDTYIHRETVDSGRWIRTDLVIFQAPDDGLFYGIYLGYGLTEYQECDPFEEWAGVTSASEDEITIRCPRMEKRRVTELKWVETG